MTYDLIKFSFACKSPICKLNINNLILICSCNNKFFDEIGGFQIIPDSFYQYISHEKYIAIFKTKINYHITNFRIVDRSFKRVLPQCILLLETEENVTI